MEHINTLHDYAEKGKEKKYLSIVPVHVSDSLKEGHLCMGCLLSVS